MKFCFVSSLVMWLFESGDFGFLVFISCLMRVWMVVDEVVLLVLVEM